MSRFNQTSQGTQTVNLAGGKAYAQSAELELVSILLTSFANEQFYRSSDDTFAQLKTLIENCDKHFAAKAAIYARTKFGMRSITHVLASEIAKHIGGEEWAKNFYDKIVHRPDDMLEILAYHKAKNGKVTNSMKKGFAKAFEKFDGYQLAKYRGENKDFKLVDAVNLVHPTPSEKNADSLAALMKGELKSKDTWETKLTQAGQKATSEEEKEEFKKEAWVSLIREKKIGYFALLRNLRNIIEQAPDILDEALDMLTNEHLIKKSLVLPFRFTTAFTEIEKMYSQASLISKVMVAINKALEISVSNVPKFDGNTLVVLDVSSSMEGKPAEIASLFAAVLLKANHNADFMQFETDARYVNVNPLDSTTTISKNLRFTGRSTNFHAIFQKAERAYDRIIILSDMQGWIGHYSPVGAYNLYKQKTGANPFIYSFDLNSYGSMQFPENNGKVCCLAGFSDKIFDIMKLVENDKNALINEIAKIEL